VADFESTFTGRGNINGGHREDGYLTGQFLIAMPSMEDGRFSKTVIYMCAHSDDGAMGLVINKRMPSLEASDLLEQLGIDDPSRPDALHIHFGGPVESGRGFVLHSADFMREGSLIVDEALADGVALTATLDILRAIADGRGPRDHILALGYAGWGPGQLDEEIQSNGWLHVEADPAILFDRDLSTKWERAIGKLGFDPAHLTTHSGHA